MNGFRDDAYAAFEEAALDKYDFTTCQRPDGSKYGSRGRCIKGSETSPASKDDKKKSSTKTFKRDSDGYEAKGAPGSPEAKKAAEKAKSDYERAKASHKELKAIADSYYNKSAPGAKETRQDERGARKDMKDAESRYKKASAHAGTNGDTKDTSSAPKENKKKRKWRFF